ncbi:tetratricopeptide repeat protein [Acidobacteriota bacterium]
MKQKFFIFLLFFCFLNLESYFSAKNTILKGVIKYHNSGGKPVQGAKIGAFNANPTVTNSFGQFELVFVDNEPGDIVNLTVIKEGLEVVNRKELEVILRRNPDFLVEIFMCKKGQRDKYAMIYYEIVEHAIKVSYEKRLEAIEEKEVDPIKKNRAINKLKAQRNAALAQAKELAIRFAEVNLDNTSDLYKIAFNYFRQGDIAKSLEILDDSKIYNAIRKAQIEKQTAEVINRYVENYKLKAQLSMVTLQFDEAESYFLKAIEAEPSNIYNFFDFAYYLSQQNQHHKSLSMYEKALPLARTERQKAEIFNNIGNLYSAINNFNDALYSYKKALEIYRNLSQKNLPYILYVAKILNNLALLYAKTNRFDDALCSYKEALEIYNKLSVDNSSEYLPYVAFTLNNLGVLYKNNNRLYEASSAYKKALETFKELTNSHHSYLPSVAKTLNNLASVYMLENEYNDALATYKKALEIKQKLAAENPNAYLPSVAMTFSNLGVLYENTNQFDDALHSYEEALKIYENFATANPQAYLPYVAKILYNSGDVYRKINRFNAAQANLKKALNIYKSLSKENPVLYSTFVDRIKNDLKKLLKE